MTPVRVSQVDEWSRSASWERAKRWTSSKDVYAFTIQQTGSPLRGAFELTSRDA